MPIKTWLREEGCYSKVKEAFSSTAADKFFYTGELLKLLEKHKNGRKDLSKKIWTVYMFLMWYNIYFGEQN